MSDPTATGEPAHSPVGGRLRLPRSLRGRLLAVALVLTCAGLIVAGIATYGSLRSFLTNRVDDQLEQTMRRVTGPFGGRPEPPDRDDRVTDQTLVGYYTAQGVRIGAVSDPELPERARVGTQEVEIDGLGSYRLLGARVRLYDRDSGRVQEGIAVVGASLADMEATLRRLLVIEVLVGLVVLGGTAAAGLALIRVGLRPLSDIESTAGAIAAGDLGRRVPDESPDTEVGRLGRSLNVMLGRIEESFAEREASERRLRRFVADASHELQTPLTSVRGYAELFRRGAADRPEDLANAMRRIEAEAERMGVLVDDLLLLARLDQGRPLELEPVDLGVAARELAGDANVIDPDHPVEVTVDGDVTLTGDEVRLRQVITNLLSNARTHTPAGTRVRIDVRRVAETVILTVSDTGPGLAPEHRDRVFERFFRADPSRARTSGGSGLGLSIVAAIAAAHGGRVDVTSSPGAGAAFAVALPVAGPDGDGVTPS